MTRSTVRRLTDKRAQYGDGRKFDPLRLSKPPTTEVAKRISQCPMGSQLGFRRGLFGPSQSPKGADTMRTKTMSTDLDPITSDQGNFFAVDRRSWAVVCKAGPLSAKNADRQIGELDRQLGETM